MAQTTYKTFNLVEAIEKGYPYIDPYATDYLDGYEWGVWRCEDDVPVEFVGADGGEPEDQLLVRDWRWVAPALERAYNLGFEHGKQ